MFRGIGAIFFAALFGLPVVVRADDPIGAILNQEKSAYQTTLDKVDNDMLAVLQRREDAARKGGDRKLLDQILAERDALNAEGKWPALIPTQDLKAQLQVARQKMEAAYARAIENYAQANNDDASKTTQDDFEDFQSENDRAPWSDRIGGVEIFKNTIRGEWQRNGSTLESTGPLANILQIVDCAPASFRMELVAQRTQGNGPLVIGFPYGESCGDMVIDAGDQTTGISSINKRASYRNETTFKGDIFTSGTPVRLLLTVRKQHVTLAAGDQTIVDWRGEESLLSRPEEVKADPRAIFLTVRGGRAHFQFNSIRIKPLLPVEMNKPTSGPILALADFQDLMPPKSHWKGTNTRLHASEHETPCEMTVVSHEGNNVVCRIRYENSAVWEWSFAIKGKSLSLGSVRCVKVADGDSHGLPALSDPQGHGSINGKEIQLSYNWRVASGDVKNQLYEGTIFLHRDADSQKKE
ncbi:MAG TPA: hypothetical protein VHS31_09385 [Tepidisphaeraceae bacterium]|jgi:hypothetical protein|nr:hypothetical protein [Tepidisphaeraceae bacterium]